MLSERSCASSRMIVSYSRSSGSPCSSASSMPSVRNLMTVSGEVWSVKRILQPTSRPQGTPSSSATRREMESAATRRGCVQAMRPAVPRPAARHILGIWVVFPEPVSPARITTWCRWMAAVISSARALIGSSGGKSRRKRGARRGMSGRAAASPPGAFVTRGTTRSATPVCPVIARLAKPAVAIQPRPGWGPASLRSGDGSARRRSTATPELAERRRAGSPRRPAAAAGLLAMTNGNHPVPHPPPQLAVGAGRIPLVWSRP